MGLDDSVWLTMLIVLVCAASFLSFKLVTHVDCSAFEIATSGLRQQTNNVFYVGESITFSVPATSKDKLSWNFGDGTREQAGKPVVQHSFLKEGDFTVSCTQNDKCLQAVAISIISRPARQKDTAQFAAIPIIGADTVVAGAAAHFSTLIKASYNYQWNLSGSPDVKTASGVDFNFYKEGLQMITLTIDGNKRYTKTVVVLPKKSAGSNTPGEAEALPARSIKIPPAVNSVYPTSGGPGTSVTIMGSFFNGTKSVSFGGIEAKSFQIVSPTEITAIVSEGSQTGPVMVTTENGPSPASSPQFTYIASNAAAGGSMPNQADNAARKSLTDANLKTLLTKVANGDPNVTAQKVAQFFCGGEGTLVKANSEKKAISLSELCKRLQSAKDVTVESAKIIHDPNNPNCETNILVTYSQPRKILGIKVGKKRN
ncbi:IPT/TIG domain-containing protein [Parafilimonas terrae]|uniref:IPT/TIG domain-containing protein n=2 Tax=Parafilimonas terrae TaxID=1465490 RepID=A0A1I5UIH0_9BACT|nr:IPT/TIG domain-containing protein [Parafilimonas terrae]